MNETNTGMSWIWVLFVVIVLYLIFCRDGGVFGGRCGNDWGCNRVSNCEVEKQGIINSAQTQFLIGQEGASTRTALHDTQDALMAQANRIYEQGLQERIFDLKADNMSLKNNFFVKEQTDGIMQKLNDCCCEFNRRLDSVECRMLKTPPFFPTGNTFQGCGCGNGCY